MAVVVEVLQDFEEKSSSQENHTHAQEILVYVMEVLKKELVGTSMTYSMIDYIVTDEELVQSKHAYDELKLGE